LGAYRWDVAGQEVRTAEAMLGGVEGDAFIADKAYGSKAVRDTVKAAGMKAVIPSNRDCRPVIRHDKALYRERRCIDRCFNKLKHLRRPATRYDRRARHASPSHALPQPSYGCAECRLECSLTDG
jgi:transposase